MVSANRNPGQDFMFIYNDKITEQRLITLMNLIQNVAVFNY